MDRKTFVAAGVAATLTPAAARAAGSEPTFVLVHGAFADTFAWSKVVPLLEAVGAKATTVRLPGHDDAERAEAGGVTLERYVRSVGDVLVAQRAPVVLVGHSMAGIVISQVAEAMPERIATLAYLSAYLPENGRSLLSYAQKDAQSKLGAGLQVDEKHGIATITPETMRAAFFNRTDEKDAAAGVARLRPEPLQPFATPVATTPERFGRIPRAYIATSDDRAVGPDLQRAMMTALPCAKTFSLAADHSSYFSATRALADALLAIGRGA